MSLINQMLRDLQERGNNRPSRPSARPPVRSRRPRRRWSVSGSLRSLPPLLWVGVGGLAGLTLLWGLSAWISRSVGPEAPVPVPQPPPEMVAVVERPSMPPVAAPAAPLRVAPVPIEVPPPAPPLAYGTGVPVGSVPVAPVTIAPAPVTSRPMTAISQGTTTFFSDQPVTTRSAPGGAATGAPLQYGRMAPQVPATVPVRPLPEGLIRAADLALEKKTGKAPGSPHRALALDPGQLQARERLVDQLAADGRAEEAYALLREGVAIAPEHTPFRKQAARLLLARGDTVGAVRALTVGGLPRVETDPELHRMLAGLYLKLGESFLAVQTGRNLTASNPRDGVSWLGLGDALAADGQPEEARRAYRQALAADGLSPGERARAEVAVR